MVGSNRFATRLVQLWLPLGFFLRPLCLQRRQRLV